MRIDIKSIKDYIKCPLYYKFYYIDNLSGEQTINDLWRDCIKTALYYYYFSILERKTKSFESILRKWESIWFAREMTEMFPEADLKEYSNKAIFRLTSYYDKISGEEVTPIAVGLPYDIILKGEDNLQVTGDIDLIKIVNDRTRKSETQIVFFSLASKIQNDFALKNDIGLTIASYAFRANFKSKEDKIVISNVNTKDDACTTRISADFARAEKIIRTICKAMENHIFYPSPNVINCAQCRFRVFCLNERAV